MSGGVEILNQTPINEIDFPVLIFVILFIAAIAVGIWVSVRLNDVVIGVGTFGIIACLSFIGCAFGSSSVPTGRYKYEAIIDDSANFKEIYERYDISDQKGKIYILKDKK